MDKSYKNVIKNLVLTHHSRDNLKGRRCDGVDRTYIKPAQIATTISKGIIGFCGDRRFKSTYKGIEVIWKYSKSDGKFVVITHYDKRKNSTETKYKGFSLQSIF